jgi:ankyrin repeat protein
MDNNIKKCLKSYLIGNKNEDKAYKYFNKSLKYLNNIKNKNIITNEYEEILTETEIECTKKIHNINMNNISIIENDFVETSSSNNIINLFDIIEKGEILELNSNNNYNLYNFDKDGDTPAHKLILYGDTSSLKKLLLFGLPIDIVNMNGNTLLETASLMKDNSIINFLLQYGSSMEKHLFFRENKYNVVSNMNYIDYSIILKMIFAHSKSDYIMNLNFLFKYFNKTDMIGFNNMTNYDLISSLETLLNTLDIESKNTYMNILREELEYKLLYLQCCPNNILEILLTFLVPFINYKFIVSIDWYIKYELKYIILNILKKNINIKKNLKKYLLENYINNNLYLKNYICNQISYWVSKIRI